MNSVCTVHIYEPLGWLRGDLLTSAGRLGAITALGEFVHNFAVSCNKHLSSVLFSNLFQNGIFSSDERHSAVTATEELLDLLMWEEPVLSTSGWKR